ncbi:MAG: hypothetical protein AB7T86_01595 [Xanthobacteraceae bacterium]|uniref:hypothetical protein n=1 Tax=Pseudolabrys sp. TaxID=1960880 RepID=UPI003D0E2647
MTGRNVYLVGSVPLGSVAEVFETVSAAFGSRIRQIPDGEVGERSDWITHLETLFRDNPALEPSGEMFAVHGGMKQRQRYRLRAGKTPRDVVFGNLGYADHALKSYAEFKRLRDAGKIAAGTRFQVDLVPAHSVLWLFIVEKEQVLLDDVYNAAVARELKTILEAIPHNDLAIQFDIASAVFARLERGEPSLYGRTKAEMTEAFAAIVAKLANRVPPDVKLQFHFCYGDANHKHAIEPTDTGDMVAVANALAGKVTRTIDLIHMPVPRDRNDDAYFAPLRGLKLKPETELVLGLVHYTDGVEGMRRRMDTATKHAPSFSVGTECGFGRRDPATIPELLRLHLAAADYR